jgi:hypothetical protein
MVGVTAALDFSRTTTAPQMVRITTSVAPVNTTCPEGYQCMFPGEADAKWPDGGYLKNNNGPCGAVTQSGDSMNYRYCYRARLTSAIVPVAAKAQPVVIGAGAVRQVTDTDKDGVPDISDNCLNVYNKDQADADHDGIGNACDNCWYVNNTDQKDVKGWCHHLIFVSEYFDANRNVWIKDPDCGDACTKPELNKNNPPVIVARPAGVVQNIAGVPAQTQTPGTGPTLSLGTLAHSPLLGQIKEKEHSPLDWLYGAVLCPGKTHCDSGCSDIKTDLYNCGGCGNVCPPGPVGSKGAAECINGQCIEHTCPNGQLYCDNAGKLDFQTAKPVGGCVDSSSDLNNCGACGISCNGTTCFQGHCMEGLAFLQGGMELNKNVPDMSKILFLTPQITQQRYYTVAGKDFNYQSDEESISTLSMGDGYSDPRGWFVGTDSTVCISAPSDPEERLFANHNILAGSQCEEGEKAYQTLEYRVKMFVDTNQFNGKPVQKATLKLSVAHTWKTQWSSSYGEVFPNGQTIKEVWYKKTDSFPVSYPDAFNNLDPLRGIYLANIPTEGVGANYAISPPDFGSPATGGQAWGTGAIAVGPQPQATWDPKARTLTIDMTDLVNEWITGHIQNHGLVLKDGWPPSAPHALFSAYNFESFEVTT